MEILKNYDDYITTINNIEYVVLFFTANWCGPCKSIYPFIDKLSENILECKFIKIDILFIQVSIYKSFNSFI